MNTQPCRCPVCGAPPSGLRFEARGVRAARDLVFRFPECGACGTVFLDPATPQPAGIYGSSYFAESAPGGLEASWIRLTLDCHVRRLGRVEPGWRVLDVGCGNGAWLEVLRAKGIVAEGLDPTPEACAAARAKGLTVHEGWLERNELPDASFDLITANHCLEHSDNPEGFLRGCARLLKPGGVLHLAIPNVESWEAQHAGAAWFHLDPPYHVCLPTQRGLDAVLERSGLRVERRLYPVLAYCQTLAYALAGRTTLPMWLVAPLLPVWALANGVLAWQGRTGTVEVRARRAA
jgi:SAM-dependent methyltransferase